MAFTFNATSLQINRLILHEIIEKKPEEQFASLNLSDDTIQVTPDVETKLLLRLNEALARQSHSFNVSIIDSQEGSFFQLATSLWHSSKEDFIRYSQEIAARLAEAQVRTIIPGGYMIVMEGVNNGHPVSVVIKAELHEAFASSHLEGRFIIRLLNNVFLSPSAKFYKIGLIQESTNPAFPESDINHSYNCLLFDEQFNSYGEPTRYFSKDFLSVDPSFDARIQTGAFYNRLLSFIHRDVDDPSEKARLLTITETLFFDQRTLHIDPEQFRNDNIREQERDSFHNKVLVHFPRRFIKDVSLIERKLSKKVMKFGNIKIEGPQAEFNTRVSIVDLETIEGMNHHADGYIFIRLSYSPDESI